MVMAAASLMVRRDKHAWRCADCDHFHQSLTRKCRVTGRSRVQAERIDSFEPLRGAEWVIDNIYTVARREQRRIDAGKPLRPEMWGHVQRLCEKAGAQSRTVGVLRSDGT